MQTVTSALKTMLFSWVLLFPFSTILGQQLDVDWIVYSEIGYSIVWSTTVDKMDNSFIYGDCRQMRIQGHELQDTGMFITKLNAVGELQWLKFIGVGYPNKIKTDYKGNILISGRFKGNLEIGDTTLTSSDFQDEFIAKYDTNGEFLWVKQINSSAHVGKISISIDKQSNIYVTFDGKVEVDGFETNGVSAIAKLNEDGDVLWAQGYQLRLAEQIPLNLNSEDNPVLYGYYSDTIEIANQIFKPELYMSINGFEPHDTSYYLRRHGIICQLDTDGNEIMAKSFSGDGNKTKSIHIYNNQIYLTGNFNDTIVFDDKILIEDARRNNNSYNHAFVCRLTDWFEVLDIFDIQTIESFGSTINSAGVFFTGHRDDIFIDRYSLDGTIHSSIIIGKQNLSHAVQYGRSLSNFSDNDVLMGGEYGKEEIILGKYTAPWGEDHRLLVARLGPDLVLKQNDLTVRDEILKVYPNPSNGNIIIEPYNSKNIPSFEIYNLSGEMIRYFGENLTKTKLSISLKPGVYVLKYRNNKDEALSSKIVVL